MSADVARGHGGDGGGDDRPIHTIYPPVAGVASLTEAKAPENPIWVAGKRAAIKNADLSRATCRPGKMKLKYVRAFPRDMSPGLPEFFCETTFLRPGKASTVALISLTETMWAPPSRSRMSPGKVSLASFPFQFIPGDMSPGIGVPNDNIPEKA
nr:hypothetical protein [Tanacetum cinerariifolium]